MAGPRERALDDTTPAVGHADTTPSPAERGDDGPVELPLPYVFRRELSRGGMGRVLIAEDRRLAREVAIKLMRGASSEMLMRFEREALLTARLQHPAVVPIYDAGRLADGTPFYAMRLVSGRSLDQLVEGRGFAERLALLPHVIAACNAMAYAHDHFIVHRDLKPQNILIGNFGETVVIDWGLAKDVREAPDAKPLPVKAATVSGTVTVMGQVLGTPAYMPPEQARGQEVDARADVYALGAVLYHLLVGGAPYKAESARQVLSAVLEAPPPPPTQLVRRVPADLAAVVQKAMARDPAARYPNAGALAEDLQKYQTGLLVGAHRYSLAERVRRFAARQRAAVAVAGVLLTALITLTVAGVARITRERDEARVQRAEAQRARAAAEGLVHYMLAELAGRLERLGRVDLLKGIGDALVRYEESTARGAAVPSERQARALELLAQAEGPKGDLATAERALAASIDVRKKLAAAAPDDAQRQRVLLSSARQLAQVRRERGASHGNPLLDEKALEELARRWPHDAALAGEIAQAWRELALERSAHEQRDASLEAIRRATRVAESAVEILPTDPSLRRVLALCHAAQSDLLSRSGRFDAAVPESDRAVIIFEQVIHERPSEPAWQRELVEVLRESAFADTEQSRLVRARAAQKRAVELVDDLVRRDPENTDWQLLRTETWEDIGAFAFDRGQYPEAQKSFETVLRQLDELAARGVSGPRADATRSDVLGCLGWIDVFGGHALRGLPRFRESLQLRERASAGLTDDSDHALGLAMSAADLGYAALRAESFDEAANYTRRAADLSEKWLAREPSSHHWVEQAVGAYGWLGAALGGHAGNEAATPAFRRMLALARPLTQADEDDGEAHATVAEALYWMLRTLGRSAGSEVQALLDGELEKLKQLRQRGTLHFSAAREMDDWTRLARAMRR